MKKKWISVFLASIMLVSLLCACSSEQSSETTADVKKGEEEVQKEPVKVTLNEVAHSIFYAPMYVAIEEGYFEDEGIDLTFVTGFGAV